jgi:DNA-binding transcriptional MerR regulator
MFPSSLFEKYLSRDERWKGFRGLRKTSEKKPIYEWEGSDEAGAIQTLRQLLTEKRYTASEADLSYRTINHWSEVGLLDDDRDAPGQGWRRFSIADLVWVYIITELRSYGVPLEKIAATKKFLFFRHPKKKYYEQEFEYYVMAAMGGNSVSLVVFDSGACEFVTSAELAENQILLESQTVSYILINVNRIVKKIPHPVLRTIETRHDYFSTASLSMAEKGIFWAIRNGNFDSITVRLKNGTVDMLEAEESLDARERVVDLLKSGNFQDISVKQNNGKVVSVKRTLKQKI